MDGSKSKHFARFERYCSIAYNILRKNANLIINMMALMVGAGNYIIHNRNPSITEIIRC